MAYERLCNEVERVAGRRMDTPQDFVWLSEQIAKRQRNTLSVNTLKRLWGRLSNSHVATRQSTLDVLAQFIGFRDYKMFCNDKGEESVQSNEVMSRHAYTKDMAKGLRVQFTWLPDRVIVAEHQGDGSFVILEVENSKLAVGDTFECALIMENEPLYLGNLIHQGTGPVAYVAGKREGVRFEIIED